jgi:hypothetical protein
MADHSATELRQLQVQRGAKEHRGWDASAQGELAGTGAMDHGGCGPADGGANTGDGTKKPGIKIKPEEAEIILTGVEHRHYDIYNIYNM